MMKYSFLTLFALFTLTFGSDVKDLSDDSFDKYIEESDITLVKFFAPWCGHCKAMASDYEKAATELKSKKISLAQVDCTVESALCKKHDIGGYPTLKIFRNNQASQYRGGRDYDSMVDTMIKQTMPALPDITADKLDEHTKSSKVVIMGFLESKDSKEYKILAELAEKFREEFLFGVTTDKAAFKAAKVTAPSVVLYKRFDEGRNDFNGAFTADSISTFIQTQSVPIMDEISPENYGRIVAAGKPIAYLFYSSPEERTKYGDIVQPLAKQFREKAIFVYLDALKYGAHGKNLNLIEKYPAFAIQNMANGSKYPFNQDNPIETEALKKFITGVFDGTIEPSFKAEEPPATNDEPVKTIVRSTYQSMVMDPKKDVLLVVHSPGCPHCVRLMPVWEEIATKLLPHPEFLVAKFDGVANDLPSNAGYAVDGFPTIVLITGETNQVVQFNDERTTESLMKFLIKNGKFGSKIGEVSEPDHDEL